MIDRQPYLETQRKIRELDDSVNTCFDKVRELQKEHNVKRSTRINLKATGNRNKIDPERARKGMAIIEKMTDEGYKLVEIAKHLNDLNILTPTGFVYSHQSVHRIKRKIMAARGIGY